MSASQMQWPAQQLHLPRRHLLPLILQTQPAPLLQKPLCSRVLPPAQPLPVATLALDFAVYVLQPVHSLRRSYSKRREVHVTVHEPKKSDNLQKKLMAMTAERPAFAPQTPH